jgi:hypothetical protein
LFGIGQLLFVKIKYVGPPPIPPLIVIIVRFDYVKGVIGNGSWFKVESIRFRLKLFYRRF